MRTRIFADPRQPNYVTVRSADPLTDEMSETEYFAPSDGGYVRINDGRNFPQVCDGLFSTGSTLEWGGRTPFVNLIRREYRKGRAADKKSIFGDCA
jgi:hypothetical protein